MEQQEQRTIRPKHRRKSINKSMKSETIFALMLASLHATSSSSTTFANPNKKQRKKNDSRRPNSYHHHQLQLQLLTQLRLSLLSKTHNSPPLFPNLTLPLPILSLLPLLLTSKYAEVVCKCAEFVGVAALFSLEMNEQIAGDDETVKGLIFALSSSNGRRSSSIAACNAVLDMATTSFGRQRLVESSFLECLMWEGFAHVALHNWNQNQKQYSSTSYDSLCGSLNAISVILMRVAIKLIGDSDPTFRKACLVGAISLLSDSEGWLDLNQRSIFSHLIKSIDAKSSFSDALRNVTMSLQENEDPLQQIRWLQHLGNDEQVIEVQEWSIPSIEQLQHLILFCHDHKDEAEAAFMEVKCKFCSEAAFEDVEKCYKILLGKYRKVRKQYTSGMLSLHCN